MVDFYKFQEHRRSGLPKVLQGKVSIPQDIQQTEVKGSKDENPGKQETQSDAEETKTSSQEERLPETDTPGKQVKDKTERPLKGVEDTSLLTSSGPSTDATMKQTSKEIGQSHSICYPLTIFQGEPRHRDNMQRRYDTYLCGRVTSQRLLF
jgi:hypothetical protein